jgi:D-arabinan exo alpha-(1,3)/(1,5)-arabinofuranosidase (non-reducing end)
MATEGTGQDAARELGQGWKVSPSIKVATGETAVLADIAGQGAVQQIWMTVTGHWRHNILRIYWDGSDQPSVECPVGDFFACGWGAFAQVSSLAVCVNPGSGFNCYWEMPFRSNCRMTLTNLGHEEIVVYYQVNYTLTDVPDDAAYFHAQFRRMNPVPYKEVFTILDGVAGRGQYVGTYMALGANAGGWWGEGEIKFYIDGDGDFPTICGTGTEDYFGGSYGFAVRDQQRRYVYQPFATPYCGMPQVIQPDGTFSSQTRFGLYRWHISDPVRFQADLRVTIQDLGWYRDRRYLPRQDDISTVAYWYQTLPSPPFPALPGKDALEIV